MNEFLTLIQVYSALYGVDPNVACGIVARESNFNPSAIGTKGEVGLFQLMPSVVRLKRKQLLNPYTNISTAFQFINTIKQECKYKDEFEWVVCYNLGSIKGNKVKHPKLFPYYKEILKEKNKCQSKYSHTRWDQLPQSSLLNH